MNNAITICRRELKSYFSSPIAYLLMGMFALSFGFMFWNSVGYFVTMSLRAQMQGQAMPMDVNEMIIAPLLGNVSVMGLFLIPMISMRLFAEENRSGTIELLMTSPIYDMEIIVGKWMAAAILYACLLGVSALDIGFLFAYGQPAWKPVLIGYLGLILQAGGLLAIGAFISTMTKNQIIAGGVTFSVCLMLWVLDWMAGYETATWSTALGYLSVVRHFQPFTKGLIDSRDVVYFATVIFFGLFLTARSLESLRWRS